MKPEEAATPEGELIAKALLKAFDTITENAIKLEKISDWALGILGIGAGFILANIDKLNAHSSDHARKTFFVLAVVSGVLGVLIKIVSAFLQFDVSIQRELTEYFTTGQKEYLEKYPKTPNYTLFLYQQKILLPFSDQLIASRPLPFQILAKILRHIVTTKDVVAGYRFLSQIAQYVMIALWFQIGTLGAACFVLGYEFIWRHNK